MRECRLLLAAGWLLAGAAEAEDYGQAGAAYETNRDDQGGPTIRGTDARLGLRYDLLPEFFVTTGLSGKKLHGTLPPPFGGELTGKEWGFDLGLGLAGHPTPSTEWYVRTDYAHARVSVDFSSLHFCCGNIDEGHVAIGGYAWANSLLKAYGEGAYTRGDHNTSGYEATAGVEFALSESFRPFVEYTYSQTWFPEPPPTGKVIGNVLAAGIRIPFGAKAAAAPPRGAPAERALAAPAPVPAPPAPTAEAKPAAPAPVPAPPAPAAEAKPAGPAPVPAVVAEPAMPPPAAAAPAVVAPPFKVTAGQAARVRPGAGLRGRPTAATAEDATPEAAVTPKAVVTNAEGTWWYVSAGGKSGWVLERDLQAP